MKRCPNHLMILARRRHQSLPSTMPFLSGGRCKIFSAKQLTHLSSFSLRRYVDFRLIPVLAMTYSFALIDRINLGAAYTAGMGADLVS